MITKKNFLVCLDEIDRMFPDAHCELLHGDEFQLVCAVMLSAQTTDESVNKVTPKLFESFPTASSMSIAEVKDIEKHIRRLGLYKNKAKNLKKLSEKIMSDYDGVVPNSQAELESLPGVGRKTANVVLSVAFDVPRIAVDTHVERVSKRLGIARWKDTPKQVEDVLMKKNTKRTME
jgi:endonuclease-3